MTASRVLIAAGGTGGHVFPALAVAQELKRLGWHAEWVGSDRGLEARVIPPTGIGLHILRFSGLRGKGAAAWLSLPLRLWAACRDAADILRRAKPDVVVAFGGYVTFPVGLMARLRQIPLCVHEQNAVMGTANRWLSKIARVVMVSFPNTRFAPPQAVLTGNPVRASISDLPPPEQRYPTRTGPLRVLVIGGSLGASALNHQLPQAFSDAQSAGGALTVRHQTGAKELAEVDARYQTLGVSAECTAFIDDMDAAYADADVLVCRAGASTVTEVAAAGIAAIFVPLPSAIDDHQTANARYLSDAQAAWLVPQTGTMPTQIGTLIAGLDRTALQARACRARQLSRPDAVQQAAGMVVTATQGVRS
jgi:UDP-N-acetylglucosamine--N-acetylmuramyl-(pentapeptide) pyrophosphoryl-undecaprenol N-acetylglucosamine transferase